MDGLSLGIAVVAAFYVGVLYGRWRAEAGRARFEARTAWAARRRYRQRK